MKNLARLYLTIALLLGVSLQGFSQSLMSSNYQVGNVLLQSRGFWNPYWLLIILILLAIGITLDKAASAKLKKSSQQDEWEKPIREDRIPTVGDWLGRFLITIIPVVGLIALIVWAIDDKDKIRKNWAIAFIIFTIFLIMLFYFLGHLFTAYLMERMGRF